jgi:hypothetical protein
VCVEEIPTPSSAVAFRVTLPFQIFSKQLKLVVIVNQFDNSIVSRNIVYIMYNAFSDRL